MTKDELFEEFKKLFPIQAASTIEYKKVGSKTIAVKLKNRDNRLYFLYNNPYNWNFGTKPWRAKPIPINKPNTESEAMQKLKEAIDEYEEATKESEDMQIEGQMKLGILLTKKEEELKERYGNED